jgi:hypothetical protein
VANKKSIFKMKSNKLLNLHTAVFQEKKIAPKLIQELLALEQKLYNLNGRGTKLEKIMMFSTDMPFHFNIETLNQTYFVEILDFFRNIEFITEPQSLQILEENNALSYFKKYVKKSDASDMKATFLSAGFGSQSFSEFDYANKTDERAQEFINNYGELPVYEVADVTRRNLLIQKVVQTAFKKLNIGAEQPILRSFLTETLSDASNSPLLIYFWTTEKAIIAVKAYCEV